MSDLFTTTNGEGAAAANDNAFKDSGKTAAGSIGGNGADGQAQSYRALKRVINRQLRKNNLAIRGKCGHERVAPLNDFHPVSDLKEFAESLGIRACDHCHRYVALVYDDHDQSLICSRCNAAESRRRDERWRSMRNGGAR